MQSRSKKIKEKLDVELVEAQIVSLVISLV